MKQSQVVLTIDLAKFLIDHGFQITDIDKNKRDINQPVFIFKYSKELQKTMDLYFALYEQTKKRAY